MITINGQEYHLQLVDTAGQVRLTGPVIDSSANMLLPPSFSYDIPSILELFSHIFLAPPLQDEYSIFPQTYSIDINGYILVYSVTSNKRYFKCQTLISVYQMDPFALREH